MLTYNDAMKKLRRRTHYTTLPCGARIHRGNGAVTIRVNGLVCLTIYQGGIYGLQGRSDDAIETFKRYGPPVESLPEPTRNDRTRQFDSKGRPITEPSDDDIRPFIRTIRERPSDPLSWHVFADFLEDINDPRHETIRAAANGPMPPTLLESLGGPR